MNKKTQTQNYQLPQPLPLQPEERELLQSIADQMYERFRARVLAARPAVDPASELWDGRVMTGEEAFEASLIDQVGYLDDAIEMARQLAALDEDASVVMLRRENDRAYTVLDKSPNSPGAFVPGSAPLAEAEPSKQTEEAAKEAKKPGHEVIVYVTSWCPACRMTTDYLDHKKIPYTVKDIEKNDKYMKEMLQKVGAYRGVPVLDINGRILLGFNPQVLDQLSK